MQFTYKAYVELLENLKRHGYHVADYHSWKKYERCVILRHDIDNDINKAVELAALEWTGGVSSTYFVLLTSDFYNIFSKDSLKGVKRISSYGHEIGLHFDQSQYPHIAYDISAIKDKIQWEARILSEITEGEIKTVSMHRPGKAMRESDMKIPGLVNSYGKTYFKDFKYLSDSRCRWREPVEDIIASEAHKRIHILTHAFWYHEEEQKLAETVNRFVNTANWERYQSYKDNLTDLSQIMSPDEVVGRKLDDNK